MIVIINRKSYLITKKGNYIRLGIKIINKVTKVTKNSNHSYEIIKQ